MAINSTPPPAIATLVPDSEGHGTVLRIVYAHHLDGESLASQLFHSALTYYVDGTHLVMRARGTERSGHAFGTAEGAAPYAFQAVRWDDGGADLIAPHVLHRVEARAEGDVA